MVQPVKTTGVRLHSAVVPAKDQAAPASRPSQMAAGEVKQVAVARDEQVDLVQAVESINAHLRIIPTALQFLVDNDTGKIVVKVVNSETNEVIRQIPSDEVLVIAKALRKSSSGSGLLINEKA